MSIFPGTIKFTPAEPLSDARLAEIVDGLVARRGS
jgi:hypothetical protein